MAKRSRSSELINIKTLSFSPSLEITRLAFSEAAVFNKFPDIRARYGNTRRKIILSLSATRVPTMLRSTRMIHLNTRPFLRRSCYTILYLFAISQRQSLIGSRLLNFASFDRAFSAGSSFRVFCTVLYIQRAAAAFYDMCKIHINKLSSLQLYVRV